MMAYHAELSPSSAFRWSSCTASIKQAYGIPNDSNEHARNGTCCHQIASEVLEHQTDLQSYLGRVMDFYHGLPEVWRDEADHPGDHKLIGSVTVTQEMIEAVWKCVQFVRAVHFTSGGTLYVEQRVPIGWFTGELDATGTSDITIHADHTLEVMDHKFGRFKVDAFDVIVPERTDPITGEIFFAKLRPNLQMASYGLGMWMKLPKHIRDQIKFFKFTILQPFIGHISQYSCTIEELMEVMEFLKLKAEETRSNPQFAPSFDNCHYCKAANANKCPTYTKFVMDSALEGFTDATDVDHAQTKVVTKNNLGSLYAIVPMIADWCKKIDALVYKELVAGNSVVRNDGLRYKLVAGKNGDRKWTNVQVVQEKIKSFGVDESFIYTKSFISPTMAEELSKSKRVKKGETKIPPIISAEQWDALKEFIDQRAGSEAPVVVLETDARPPVASKAEGFVDVETRGIDPRDLF